MKLPIDPKHKSDLLTEWFEDNGIEVMDWPSQNPDLNPIENLWDELGGWVRSREQPPVNRQTLIQALQEEWTELPHYYARQLVQSMHQRCLECVQAQGRHTHY